MQNIIFYCIIICVIIFIKKMIKKLDEFYLQKTYQFNDD